MARLLISFHPETVFFRDHGSNRRDSLRGVLKYTQYLDFLDLAKKSLLGAWKRVPVHLMVPGCKLIKLIL
jgi:hypothetical protein